MLFANLLYEESNGHVLLRAMPLLLIVLCVLAIAYRYYSAFLAAKVMALDDSRVTPAHAFNDGNNYHPTNKWVLFGHHFAAISGAGPLIGPVLAIQYGYMPGLLWILVGVTLAGAVQDMLVLAASVRRGGKSLAQIARAELGAPAAMVVSLAILVIVVIALAGLGFVVVKALGGDEAQLPAQVDIVVPTGLTSEMEKVSTRLETTTLYHFPPGCSIGYSADEAFVVRSEKVTIRTIVTASCLKMLGNHEKNQPEGLVYLIENGVQIIPGSSWGTFTIACTIPIALFVGLWMYKIRKGHVVEASIIGGVGVLAATVAGALIPGSPLEPYFSLTKNQTVFALCAYGFVASVLPVWMLLCPRDYISSFLKIGTIAILIIGTIAANPVLPSPMVNETFAGGGPTFAGSIFPFVFICIMCGSISGFHALVSSGTTPKMIDKESDIRPIGYGAMLMEGLVGVVALLAAASLPVDIYYDINVGLEKASDTKLQSQLEELRHEYAQERLPAMGGDIVHLNVEQANLGQLEQLVGGESLRGRTGGAVTLAVGMARILTTAMDRLNIAFEGAIKYWYHFAIMFEALFILTTIDTGTRIARFLLQESLGKFVPRFEKADWLPGAALSTLIVTLGWGGLVATGSIDTIWPMFGIANQLLSVLALCLVATLLINSGRARYAPLVILPMAFVTTTTMTAGVQMMERFSGLITSGQLARGYLNMGLTLFVMMSVGFTLLLAVSRWIAVLTGMIGGNGSQDLTTSIERLKS